MYLRGCVAAGSVARMKVLVRTGMRLSWRECSRVCQPLGRLESRQSCAGLLRKAYGLFRVLVLFVVMQTKVCARVREQSLSTVR